MRSTLFCGCRGNLCGSETDPGKNGGKGARQGRGVQSSGQTGLSPAHRSRDGRDVQGGPADSWDAWAAAPEETAAGIGGSGDFEQSRGAGVHDRAQLAYGVRTGIGKGKAREDSPSRFVPARVRGERVLRAGDGAVLPGGNHASTRSRSRVQGNAR